MQKKRWTRQMLSLLLAFALVISAIAPNAFAEETGNGAPVIVTNESPTGDAEPSPSAEPTPTADPESYELQAPSVQSIVYQPPGIPAYEYLTYLSSTIGTRVAGSPEDVAARDYITGEFAKLGLGVDIQPFSYTSKDKTINSSNVIATKAGTSDKVVIVGAHYDSVAASKGADDNGSGVAVMMEAARTVADKVTPYTIKFIAFGAEETGLRGSKAYVAKMSQEDKDNTIAMINLDSLAVGDNMHIYGNAGSEGFVRDLGLDIAKDLHLDVTTQQGVNPEYPAGTTGDWSDHAPFKDAGIPYGYLEATNWLLGDMDGYTQTELEGEVWHTEKDTLDHISATYPGRIENHLSTFSQLLSNILLEIQEPQELKLNNEVSNDNDKDNDKAAITETRTFDVEFDLPSGSALSDLAWTYGGKDFSEYKKYNSTDKVYSGDPYIKLVGTPVEVGGKVHAKVMFDQIFGTSNMSGNRTLYPPLLKSLNAANILAVADKKGNVAKVKVPYNVYDDYHAYDDIKPAINEIMASPDKQDRYIENKVIGKSGQGRDINFSIVAKDKDSVDKYLNEILPLMNDNPAALQEKIKSGELTDYKVPIWINNIHPDEAPGVDAIINIFRSLVTKDTVSYETTDDQGNSQTVTLDVDSALDNVIFLLNYTENPDGRFLNTRQNAAGFDLNRDNSYQTQPETQQVMGELAKWMPTTFLDFHGFVKEFLIEPCTPPHDPNFEYDLLIDNMVEQANLMGRAGVANTKYDVFHIPYEEGLKAAQDPNYKPIANATGWDDGSPAYTAVFAMHHGAMGHTVEIPELNQDSTDALYYTALAATKYLVDNKDELFLNQLEIYKRGVNNEDNKAVDKYLVNAKYEEIGRPRTGNENFFPEYYVLPVDAELQKSPSEAYKMVKYLLHNGVEVERTKESVTVGSTTYPSGTFVVNMHQASRGFANVVLYDGFDVSDFKEMYSDIIQSFPEMRGFDSYETRVVGAFTGKTSELTDESALTIPGTTVSDEANYYVVRSDSNAAIQAVNELIAAGKKVTLLENGDGRSYEKGDFLVESTSLTPILSKYVLTVVPFPNDGNQAGIVLKPVTVGATAKGVPEFVLKQLGFKVTNVLDEADVLLNAGNAAQIKAKPYIGFGKSGMSVFKNANVLTGFDYKTENAYEGLYKAELSQDSIITAPYEAEDYLYTNTGSYITGVPTGATVIATIKNADDFFVAGWWPTQDAAKGKTAGFTYKKDGLNATIFASDSFNKDHPQAQFRLMAEAVYASLKVDVQPPYTGGPYVPPVTPPTDPVEPPTEPTTPVTVPDFKDLGKATWAITAIQSLAAKGIVTGVSADKFEPLKQVTRAEFLTMLIRAFGLLDKDATVSFGDVPSGAWYYSFVATAVKLKLAQGVGGDKFDPTRPITREEMAILSANVLKSVKGKQAQDPAAALLKFKDSSSMASYSKDSIALLTEEGVINGVSADTFSPKGIASRAQAAVIIDRLMGIE
ncbi:M20/M25/M40 family metallo-hydrolase [Cohnella lupini]|uniref:Zinc carboxypeptidase n=1 Tax=Cohnella lupini TaxID=1294267 RepID=A0A3D9HSS8_9BACL|nr:M20/M25/M40 family metallo-hydrolase [Cohnella lupini]RED52562.1 zinc carboxypeptidase [Cohnella lupini]